MYCSHGSISSKNNSFALEKLTIIILLITNPFLKPGVANSMRVIFEDSFISLIISTNPAEENKLTPFLKASSDEKYHLILSKTLKVLI